LTRNGQSAAVLIGAAQFDAMLDRLELLEDLETARGQIERGETISHDEVKEIIRKRNEP
jgi:PHD/YefM family antitoxin component YafN of YafNO toxin-antitoxin module